MLLTVRTGLRQSKLCPRCLTLSGRGDLVSGPESQKIAIQSVFEHISGAPGLPSAQ